MPKLGRAHHPKTMRRTQFPGPAVDPVIETQERTLAITQEARLRLLEDEYLGELAARDAVVDSWRDRCMALARERHEAQAEVIRLRSENAALRREITDLLADRTLPEGD